MKKYVEFASNHRKPLLILLVIINIFAVMGIIRINISSRYDIFVPRESEYKDNMDYMKENFDSSDSLIIMIEMDTSTIDIDSFAKFRKLQKYLNNIAGIIDITGPAPEFLGFGELSISAEKITENEIPMLADYYNQLGKLSPVVYSNDKTYGIFQVFVSESFESKTTKDIEKYLQNENYEFYLSGDLYMQQKMLDYIILILSIIPPMALLLILFVFNIRIKSFKGTLMSVLPAGIGALWTLGAIGWFGSEVSVITILAPIFTIVIGSADGLHFVTHVQEARKEGKDRFDSITVTLKMVGIPMIITTVTSVAGFMALLAMKTDAIRSLALFASMGITFAGIATWYVLPVILSGKVNINTRNIKSKRDLLNIKKLWGLPSVIIVLVFLIIAGLGFPSIQTEFNQLMIYKDSTEVSRSFMKILDVNNGSVPVFLTVKTNESLFSPEISLMISSLQNELEELEYVGKTISVFDVLAITPPSAQKDETSNESGILSNLVNINKNILRLMIFPMDFNNSILDGIEEIVDWFSVENPEMDFKLTGSGYLMRDLNKDMAETQSKSLLLAFALILILLFISIRKIVPVIFTIAPIAITVIVLYGFLGLSGISLNVFTATIFCITIGVGIDYAVHYTSVFMEFKKQGFSSSESVDKAYKYTSKPIIANAMGIAIGMSALFVSPLKIHTNVAILLWVSMICGVILSLSFLPTLLKGTNPDKPVKLQ